MGEGELLVGVEKVTNEILDRLFSRNKQREVISIVGMAGTDTLRKHLYGKKYLIVIDDVWHDNVWNELESCFPDNNNSSRILMTTRIKEVANLCKSPVNLSLLGQVESWTLFCQKAFREKRCLPMLEEVAREIVKRCGGLPLAIVVIARLLSNKEMTVTSWSQFAESMDAHHDDQE
ncbi:hypothetical protein HAX54_024803, partial [Datura stramonium]|nr:hypothetical protein [Datura stramonium]